jgi:DNA-binding transcriptional LysR family regulator
MEFRQLTYFLAATQTCNFRKAAELCLVAQSALSRQIAALETELGVELFKRINRRVELTPAGQEFAVYAQNALEQLQQGQQAMLHLKSGEQGTVLVGCVEALATTLLPQVFTEFNRRYPGIRMQVSVRGADQIMELVEQSQVDFGLIFDPATRTRLISVRELFRQPIQVVLALNHPMVKAGKQSLTLEEIVHEPLILLREGYGLRRIAEGLFARRGLPVQPLLEIDSIEALKEFVKQGVGISLMPTALIRPDQIDRELSVLPIRDLSEEFIFALVYRRIGTLSMAARALIDTITSTIK